MTEDRQCKATSKQSGLRCKRLAIRGGTVCSMHGGKTPAVAAAAEQRVLEAQADATLRKLWTDLEHVAPVTDPIAAMQLYAGQLRDMLERLGVMVNDLDSVEAEPAQVRGLLVAHDRASRAYGWVLERMQSLGIAAQQLQLEQDKARMVAVAVQEAMEAVGMSPEDRETFTRVLLGRMRTVEAVAS